MTLDRKFFISGSISLMPGKLICGKNLWLLNKNVLKVNTVAGKYIKVDRRSDSVYPACFIVLPEAPFPFNTWLLRLQIMGYPYWVIIKIVLEIVGIKINICVNNRLCSVSFFHSHQPFFNFFLYLS